MTSIAVQNIQDILSQQKTMARPSAAVCAVIAGLKDLCEITSPQVDWRRQTQAPNSAPRQGFRGSPQGAQSFPRTASAFSLGSSGSESPMPSSPAPSKKSGQGHRYHSQFKDSSKPVEDKILNNIILSKLNKFCPTTYTDTKEFLYQILGSGEPDLSEMIRQFMLLVFKKAASEEIYCSLYAKLLSEISQTYGVILEEMNTLQKNYLSIFDEVEEKEANEQYAAFVEKNIEKRYRQGYSQFIAELSLLEIIQASHLQETFQRIFESILKNITLPDKRTIIEEYIDCLFRMSRVFKRKTTAFALSAKKSLMEQCKTLIDNILQKKDEYVSLSSKARFILMDVKDNLSS